jgi:hypothetical protein
MQQDAEIQYYENCDLWSLGMVLVSASRVFLIKRKHVKQVRQKNTQQKKRNLKHITNDQNSTHNRIMDSSQNYNMKCIFRGSLVSSSTTVHGDYLYCPYSSSWCDAYTHRHYSEIFIILGMYNIYRK